MTTHDNKNEKDDGERLAYTKPKVERVALALTETLSSGCKLEGVCDDPFQPGGAISEAGS